MGPSGRPYQALVSGETLDLLIRQVGPSEVRHSKYSTVDFEGNSLQRVGDYGLEVYEI